MAANRPVYALIHGRPLASGLTGRGSGCLQTTTQGTHVWTQGYDGNGFPSSLEDPLSLTTSSVNDAVGRPKQTTLADNRVLLTGWDGDGNMTSVTLPADQPNGPSHGLLYTPVDLLQTYSPPAAGAGNWSTQYGYDLDQRIKLVTMPDGSTIQYNYDAQQGHLNTLVIPQGTSTWTYTPATGQVHSIATPDGETLTYAYDGFLQTGLTWSGPVAGSVTLGFDGFFRQNALTLGGTPFSFGYDNDGLLKQAGAMTLTPDPANGRLTGTSLGSVTDAYTYDPTFGLLSSYVAKFGSTTLYSESIDQRYADGRIQQRTETVQGTTHVWVYTYDPTGRLTDVTEDGAAVSHYGYDADDNRTTYHTFGSGGSTVVPQYDVQDRLTSYGSTTYAFGHNGDLQSKTGPGGTTHYVYDVLGNLLSVTLPSGESIGYVVDGENRRVGKAVNGTLTSGYLYKDALNVVVQLDGSGNVVSRFVFGSKPNVPDYFTNASGTFRILSDHLGSPRLVVNTSTGAVIEEIDYDEFGNVTKDTAPGTIPFGFAGGLYDKDTGLVRFGARDYDASVGRWTGKDPTRFDGGMNLYGYVVNDPVNMRDPQGTDVLCDLLPFLCGPPAPTCQPPDCMPFPPPGPTPPSPPPPPPSPPICTPSDPNGQQGTKSCVCYGQPGKGINPIGQRTQARCQADCCSDGWGYTWGEERW